MQLFHCLAAIRAALAAASLIASASLAAAAPHIRGEVTAIDGDVATVATADGETVEVKLKPDFGLILYTPIAIGDVKPNDYLSIPALVGANGAKQAIAINVFPEALRGVAEGESDWDIAPESRMINATVVGALKTVGTDHSLVVTYGGADETILVPDGAPITSFAPAPDRKLAVGDNAVFFAEETPEGLLAGRAGVTADGSLPPI